MFRNEKLEIKVGLFTGIGLGLMFLFAFFISDSYLWGEGYSVNIFFDYVNGITESAPIRLAGVNVGEVENIGIIYDENLKKTSVQVKLWIHKGIRISEDSMARINTLGLLGEQYLEISPGSSSVFVADGGEIAGKNPVNVGQQMEKMGDFVGIIRRVLEKLDKGEGTLGKLINDDQLYDNLADISDRLERGEGTLGKLLVEDDVYDDLKSFASDIKAHPWKLIHKTKTSDKKMVEEDKALGGGSNFGR